MSRSAHLQHRRKVHHPERYVGAHPFNPPQLIPLVELTKGDRTSNDALDRALAFYRAMGKDPIVLQIGFVANRISHGETCFSPPKLFILDEKRDFIKIRLFSRIFPKSLDSIYIYIYIMGCTICACVARLVHFLCGGWQKCACHAGRKRLDVGTLSKARQFQRSGRDCGTQL